MAVQGPARITAGPEVYGATESTHRKPSFCIGSVGLMLLSGMYYHARPHVVPQTQRVTSARHGHRCGFLRAGLASTLTVQLPLTRQVPALSRALYPAVTLHFLLFAAAFLSRLGCRRLREGAHPQQPCTLSTCRTGSPNVTCLHAVGEDGCVHAPTLVLFQPARSSLHVHRQSTAIASARAVTVRHLLKCVHTFNQSIDYTLCPTR